MQTKTISLPPARILPGFSISPEAKNPGNLIHPAAWNGHGHFVGCTGLIENSRGVSREFAPVISHEAQEGDELFERQLRALGCLDNLEGS